MDTGLSAVTDMLSPISGANKTLSRSSPARGSGTFAANRNDNESSFRIPQPPETDNIPADTPNPPLIEPQQTSDLNTNPAQSKPVTNTADQNASSGPAASQPALIQSWLDQYPLVEHGKNGLARDIGPKAGYELAKLLAELRAGEFPAGLQQQGGAVQNLPTASVPDKLNSEVPSSTISGAQNQPTNDSISLLQPTTNALKPVDEQNLDKQLSSSVAGKTAAGPAKPSSEGITASNAAQEKLPAHAGSSLTAGRTASDQITGLTGLLTTAQKPLALENQKNADDGNGKNSDAQLLLGNLKNQKSNPETPESAAILAAAGQKEQSPSRLSDANKKDHNPDASVDMLVRKSGLFETQTAAGQSKNQAGYSSNKSDKSALEQLLARNNAQLSVMDQSSAFSPAAKPPANSPATGLPASVGEQIFTSAQASLRQGDRQVIIQLNPPELGKVSITFQEKDNQITGLLEVTNSQTRAEIQQAIPGIIRNLADSGILIKRLEVLLSDSDSSGHQAYRDQSLQDGSPHQHAFTDSGSSDNADFYQGLLPDNAYPAFSRPDEILGTGSSINVLM